MAELKFRRFTLNQRIQHILFFTSFILLAYTGFPLKFPEAWWSEWMIASVGGFDNRTIIHHYSGLVMIGVSLYHVVFHLLDKPRCDVLFNLKDIKDFKQQIWYFLRFSDEHPRFGRYTWKQKFEYFGAGFGAVVMGLTGILMWQPFEAMKFLPIGAIQIASLFHTWEAVLASLAVFIGHFYDEHFGKFPNFSWITGNINEEEMRHEHPEEYDYIMANPEIQNLIQSKAATGEEHKKHNRIVLGFAKLLFSILFLAICIWMLWISYKVLFEAINTYIMPV